MNNLFDTPAYKFGILIHSKNDTIIPYSDISGLMLRDINILIRKGDIYSDYFFICYTEVNIDNENIRNIISSKYIPKSSYSREVIDSFLENAYRYDLAYSKDEEVLNGAKTFLNRYRGYSGRKIKSLIKRNNSKL